MSFASETKNELARKEIESTCCAKAELAALIRMNGSMGIGQRKIYVDVKTENPATARRIFSLTKHIYNIQPEIVVRRKMRLKKNNSYLVRINEMAQEILQDLKIIDENNYPQARIDQNLIVDNCCQRAYLRGAFLAAGSVNDPETSSYHLEISSTYEEHCLDLLELANSFDLNAKCIERKKNYVLYIKESELISAFMILVEASNAVFKLEDARIIRDIRNSVNRQLNCDKANIQKTVDAAGRQLDSIRLIDQVIGLDQLPDRLREVAEVRLENPEDNLTELGEKLSVKISKSGVNHRLRKINEIADKLVEEGHGP